MTDIFKKVKSIFTNLKSFITTQETEPEDPYDKLVARFNSPKPLEVNELDDLKSLCRQVADEEGQEIIDKKFDIIKDIMLEKVVEASCKSRVTVEDRKIKNKREYKDFIKKEYKRMVCHNTEEEKKEVKRVKTNTHDFKNEVSWGILPDKWRLVRENAPVDVLEFALNNTDESKGPVVFMGDVPSDQEASYFNEEFLNCLYKKNKPQDIICDLYNPNTNCRKCIRYEFNQERLKILKEEKEREMFKEEELREIIKERLGTEMDCSEKLIQKTTNPEDKVWLSFLFNKDFKFSVLSEEEKNLFFNKLKKSGVLCMDALENTSENMVNKKTKEFAKKRELFDFKENTDDLFQESVFESKKDEMSVEENNQDVEKPKIFNFTLRQETNKEVEYTNKPQEETKNLFNSPRFSSEDKDESKDKQEHHENKKDVTPESGSLTDNLKFTFEIKKDVHKEKTSKEETKPFSLNLPPPVFNSNEKEETKKNEFKPFTLSKETPPKVPENWHFFPKYPAEINKDPSINSEKSNESHPPVFKRTEAPSFSNLSPLTSTKLNLEETKKDDKANSFLSTNDKPNSFLSSNDKPNPFISTDSKLDQTFTTNDKPNPFLNTFLPVNNNNGNLNTSTGSFSFTPSNNFFPSNSNQQTLSPNINSSPSSFAGGPSKRKRDGIVSPSKNAPFSTFNNQTSPPFLGQTMLQTPSINNNPEFNKLMEIKQNNVPFLGEVVNPFETSNPLQHSRNDSLNFVDNTFKFNDVFNKNNQNLFLNSKSMFDDLIFDKGEDQESNVKYLNKKDDKNGGGGLFGSNLFGNDNDPWNK